MTRYEELLAFLENTDTDVCVEWWSAATKAKMSMARRRRKYADAK